MKQQLITIVIPIYKVNTSYLKKCLTSVQNQTYQNLEVLLILDGSPAKIIDYCKNFSKNDNRFTVISRKNKGVSFSRNEGMKKAKGQWITFVDADDWLEPNMCELFINQIEKYHNKDFVMFRNFINSKEEKEVFYQSNEDCVIDKHFKQQLFQSTYGTKYAKFLCCEAVWKNFYNTDFLRKNNIQFDNNIRIGEDLLFNYKIWNNSADGYFINKAVYHYRRNNESAMNEDAKNLIAKYEELFPKFIEVTNQLPPDYKENRDLFIVRQLDRFLIKYYFNTSFKYREFKEIMKNPIYKNSFMNANLDVLNNKKRLINLFIKKEKYLSIAILMFIASFLLKIKEPK